jgi:hypothetical protein
VWIGGRTPRLRQPSRPAVYAHTPADLDEALAPLGWHPQPWYGVRVFCDHRDENTPPTDELEPLLAAEREAGHRDP